MSSFNVFLCAIIVLNFSWWKRRRRLSARKIDALYTMAHIYIMVGKACCIAGNFLRRKKNRKRTWLRVCLFNIIKNEQIYNYMNNWDRFRYLFWFTLNENVECIFWKCKYRWLICPYFAIKVNKKKWAINTLCNNNNNVFQFFRPKTGNHPRAQSAYMTVSNSVKLFRYIKETRENKFKWKKETNITNSNK